MKFLDFIFSPFPILTLTTRGIRSLPVPGQFPAIVAFEKRFAVKPCLMLCMSHKVAVSKGKIFFFCNCHSSPASLC